MPDYNRGDKLQKMELNYSKKRSGLTGQELAAFHRKHLVLFTHRFGAFVSHYKNPTSHLLDHDLFLAVEAASRVASEDLTRAEYFDDAGIFKEYFEELAKLKTGSVDLRTSAARCLAILECHS
jgi:hypothetical protein